MRTRDAAKLADLDVVIDVGGVYDLGSSILLVSRVCTRTVAKLLLLAYDNHVRRDLTRYGKIDEIQSRGYVLARVVLNLVGLSLAVAEKKRFDHHQREFDGVFGHGSAPTPLYPSQPLLPPPQV